MATSPPPLDGIRVADLTSYIAGSYAAMQLADLGADVVKVEAPEGDSFRELPGFFGWNRGKRSITVNLKTPEGRRIVERLAARADVFMENMRPGVADRLGVGHARLAAQNPRLIYCSITAFGSTGPSADRPGFDPILQALGGLMTLQGFGGPPQYLRTAPTDYYTAALAAQAVLAAHDIPAAPVQPLLEFFEDPAVRHHDMIHTYDHPEVGRLRLMGQPLGFDDTPTRDPGPPPTLGQHTDAVLRELGYDAAAIADLRARGVLGA